MKNKNLIYKDPVIRQVILLTVIGSFGFILNLIINSYLLKISDSYSSDINNQLAKKELGAFLHNKISKIETNLRDLVSHTEKKRTYFIKEDIEKNLTSIKEILIVISQGGTYVQELPVNFYQNNFIKDSVVFVQKNKKKYNLDIIDITPKIIEINRITNQITELKIQSFHQGYDKKTVLKIKNLDKEINTYLQRAFENSNRIFYETQLEYQSIKQDKQEELSKIRRFKSLWVSIISLSTLFLLFIIIRRIVKMVHSQNEDKNQLVKSKNAIEKILDTIPVGFIIFNNKYEAIQLNKHAVNLFSAAHENNLLNKNCHTLFADQDEDICPLISKSDQLVTNELRIKTLLGNSKSVIKNATRIEIDGKEAVLETFVDITDRKQIEENLKLAKEAAEIATHEKSKFLAGMSHEIRTPLNGIIGMASLLKNTNLNSKQKDYLDIIQISSNNLVSIITDILDFSKIEAGEVHIEKHTFNLKEEIANNLKVLSLKAEEKGITLNLEIIKQIPDYIIADSIRIKQVFINLVSNAIKFTHQGFVKIVLSYSEESKKIKLRVIDTGIGIPENRIEKIFNAFAQSDSSVTRKYGGTGLGLTISKELIQLMGGEIGAMSKLDKGSEFWFEIPIDIGRQPQSKTKQVFTENSKKADLSILVAEDNIINQKVAKAIFYKLGYNIDIANNGKEAVDFFSNNFYDIIFMDLQMPIMDGLTATKNIIEMAKKNKQSVFITAMTANALKEDKQKCSDAGMSYFLSKPYKPENLEEAIEYYLNHQK